MRCVTANATPAVTFDVLVPCLSLSTPIGQVLTAVVVRQRRCAQKNNHLASRMQTMCNGLPDLPRSKNPI